MSRHKLKNQALCNQQNGLCALCSQPIPEGPNRMCYYEPKNVVICRTCNVAVHNYTRLIEPGGIMVADMTAFLAREPAPEPTTTDMAKHKKLTPEQLRNRLLAAKGGWAITLEEFDRRAGSSGPVVNPETGLEWVASTGWEWTTPESEPEPIIEQNEQTPSDERIYINGTWCGADGKPLTE